MARRFAAAGTLDVAGSTECDMQTDIVHQVVVSIVHFAFKVGLLIIAGTVAVARERVRLL